MACYYGQGLGADLDFGPVPGCGKYNLTLDIVPAYGGDTVQLVNLTGIPLPAAGEYTPRVLVAAAGETTAVLEVEEIPEDRLWCFAARPRVFSLKCGEKLFDLVEGGRLELSDLLPESSYLCHASLQDGVAGNRSEVMDQAVALTTRPVPDFHFEQRGTRVFLNATSPDAAVLSPGLDATVRVYRSGSGGVEVPASEAMEAGVGGLGFGVPYQLELLLWQRPGHCSFDGCQKLVKPASITLAFELGMVGDAGGVSRATFGASVLVLLAINAVLAVVIMVKTSEKRRRIDKSTELLKL